MKENLDLVVASVIQWLILAIVFVTPLLFSPWSFDFYEFPKQVFLWIAATILLVLWLFRFVLNNEVRVIKTPVDLPLLLFIVVSAVSMLLSSSRYTSLVGFFGRPDGGLASILAYTVVFYIAASTIGSVKQVIRILVAFLASAAILAIIGMLYYFHVYFLPWQSVNVSTFSPAGGMYSLTLILGMAMPIGLGLLFYLGRRDKMAQEILATSDQTTDVSQALPTDQTGTPLAAMPLMAIVTIASFLFLAVIAILGNLPAWVAVIVAMIVFFLWSKRGHTKAALPYVAAIIIAGVLWVMVAGIPQVRSHIPGFNQKIDQPQVLSAHESWYIASNSMRDLPFFGSGPATYLYDFTRYHSQAYNLQDSWTLRYLVAHDQYLQVLTTLGALGIAAYLFFIGRILVFGFRTVLRNREVDTYPLKVSIFAALVAFAAATLFVATTTTVMETFFVLLAVLMILEKLSGSHVVSERKLAFVLTSPNQTSYTMAQNNIVPFVLFIPGLLLAAGIFFATAQYTRANAAYVQGVSALSSNKPSAAQTGLADQTQAVLINPWEDGYHRDLARTSFNIALAVSQKQNLSDQDKQTVTALLQSAISQAQRAASLAPLDANNWQTLADIYRNIAAQVQGAGDASLQAYAAAIQVDQNPQLYLNVGGIFFAANSYDQAIEAFKQAVALKPNYANAYYNLANAYVKKSDYNNAYAAYQVAQSITQSLPDSDPGKKSSLDTLTKEMAAIADKVSTQSATTQTSSPQPQASTSPTVTVVPSGTPASRKSTAPSATPRATIIPQATP